MTTLQTVPAELSAKQSHWLETLRQMADFLEARPDLIPDHKGIKVLMPALTGPKFADLANELGSAEKEVDDNYAELTKGFGPHRYQLFVNREEVCTRTQVGEREVVRQVAPPGIELIEETVIEPVYEWECVPWLAR